MNAETNTEEISRETLEAILNDNFEHIVAPADCRFLRSMIDKLEKRALCGPLREAEAAVVKRIADHAEYHRESGEVRYRLNNAYVTGEDMLRVISGTLSAAKELKFLSDSQMAKLSSIGLWLKEDRGYLSAKQVGVVEIYSQLHRNRQEELGKGTKFLISNSGERGRCKDFAMRIINYSLTGKKTLILPSEGKMTAFWRKYSDGNSVDLTPLRKETESFNCKGHYLDAISLLEKYLNKVSPDTHRIGFGKAVPKGPE